jgi:hypothetical protein
MICYHGQARKHGGILVTWVYDEIGYAGAILDEFCLRNLAGNAVGWVFGLSVFSLEGDHIGWSEGGVLYDIENKVLGFVPGAAGLALEAAALAPEPPLPKFNKRPCVPLLRGRSARPAGGGWSSRSLGQYLSLNGVPPTRSSVIAQRPPGTGHGLSHECCN